MQKLALPFKSQKWILFTNCNFYANLVGDTRQQYVAITDWLLI